MGILGIFITLLGGWVFAIFIAIISYQASQEYFHLIIAKNILKKVEQTSKKLTFAFSFASALHAIMTQMVGEINDKIQFVTIFYLFLLQMVNETKNRRFDIAKSRIFGLFYCGLLPSFWIGLRLHETQHFIAHSSSRLQVLFQGLSQSTSGLVFTIVSAACVVAADIGAYFIGKQVGKIKLTKISPNKTVEGAIGGFLSSILVAIGLGKTFGLSLSCLIHIFKLGVWLLVRLFFSQVFLVICSSVC